jgi:hypothetical protein
MEFPAKSSKEKSYEKIPALPATFDWKEDIPGR